MNHREMNIEITGCAVIPTAILIFVGAGFLIYQLLRLVGVV